MQRTEQKLQQMLAGSQKNIPATSTVDVNGMQWKQSDIVAKLQGFIQLYQKVDEAKGPYQTAQQALNAGRTEVTQFLVQLGQALKQVFGKGSPLLSDFGLIVVQRKIPSAETRVLAHAKLVATRAARKTMGSQQKKTVKGAAVATVVVGTAVQAAAAPSVSPVLAGPAPNAATEK